MLAKKWNILWIGVSLCPVPDLGVFTGRVYPTRRKSVCTIAGTVIYDYPFTAEPI